jgi:hypothetical protein
MQLASNFSYRSPVLRSESPLSDAQIRTVAPSIFAEAPHESRSERYSYIPTATLLQELRGEGFGPSWCVKPECAGMTGVISPST